MRLSQPWQLQDRDNEGRGFIRRSNLDAGYLSCFENPTDARSIVCDAKEVLAIAIKDCLGFALTGVFKFELMVCLGYHSCLTQRLRSHKHAESVVYLLPIIILFLKL